MQLTIRFTDGARAGETLTLESSSKRILVGRDPDTCTVLFPGDATQVGRRHCALTFMFGEYRLGIFHGYLVTVDGKKARDGQPIDSGAVCRLGPEGPRFVVEYGPGDGMLSTLTQQPSRKSRSGPSWLPRILRRDKNKS